MNRSKKVLIAGAGQLGFRYLQGTVQSPWVKEVWVYDISPTRLAELSPQFDEAKGPSVQFVNELKHAPSDIDLAIISTSAHVRMDVVKEISAVTDTPNWILEKILCQSPAETTEWSQLSCGSSRYWVNTFFRTVPMFQEIKRSLSEKAREVRVHGGNWGLICNSIHFIDFAEWLFESEIESIDASGLLPAWVPAKRQGFYEAFGSIRVLLRNGSVLEMNCDDSNDSFIIDVLAKNHKWSIDWAGNFAENEQGGRLTSGIPYQSQMTPGLLHEVFSANCCMLPELLISARQHGHLLAALLKHWNDVHQSRDTKVPIT